MSGSWEVGNDVEEIHALLCASDAHHANDRSPAPSRNIETTRERARTGAVHVFRHDGEAIAMFTLTQTAPFAEPTSSFPAARQPTYLSRLVVAPHWLARDRERARQHTQESSTESTSGRRIPRHRTYEPGPNPSARVFSTRAARSRQTGRHRVERMGPDGSERGRPCIARPRTLRKCATHTRPRKALGAFFLRRTATMRAPPLKRAATALPRSTRIRRMNH
jgi:hypothetical protein